MPGEKAVVFCASIQHAMEVAELFRDSGVKAEVVEGRMKKRDREAVLENYHQDKVKVLCACDILNEGWDARKRQCCSWHGPLSRRFYYLQQLGR